jgi:hypothetical protein
MISPSNIIIFKLTFTLTLFDLPGENASVYEIKIYNREKNQTSQIHKYEL